MREDHLNAAKQREISVLALIPIRGPHPAKKGISKVFTITEPISVTGCHMQIESKQRLGP